MEEHKNIIVVPWDFTHIAGHALAHAVKISRMVGNDICLLHIADPAISQKDGAAARSTMLILPIISPREAYLHQLLNMQMLMKQAWW